MKKNLIKIFLTVVFCLLSFVFYSQQNFVPNPSFEDTAIGCPNNSGQINRAKHWFTVNGSPDYFNRCYNGPSNYNIIPYNSFTYQQPNHNSCDAYSGVYTSAPTFNNINEIFASKLIDSLIIGTKYFFSIKSSLSNFSKYATNNLGALFSTKQPIVTGTASPNNFCHINFNQIVTDTLNWTPLFKSFVSDSNYKYIRVGNFKDSSLTTKLLVNSATWAGPSTYYVLDDVCLSTDSSFVFNYTYNCTLTSIYEKQNTNEFKIYPNPVVSDLIISTTYKDVYSISIINSFGKEMVVLKSIFGDKKMNVNNYNNGIYILKIFDRNNNILANLKLIIFNP